MWQRTVDCLGIAVSIVSEVPSIDDQLEAVFRSYADARTKPELGYVLRDREQPTLFRNGKPLEPHDRPLDLVAGLQLDLNRRVTARAAGLVLHAAAVVGLDGKALVFAGISGAGKSTLLRALLECGGAYLTEECVALRGGTSALGLARALHVEDDSVAPPAGFVVDDYWVSVGADTRRTRLFHPPEARMWRQPARPAAIVVLSHGPDAPNTLVRISTGEALVALWPMVFRGSPLEMATELGDLPCYRLQTTTPANAQRLACDLAEELGVRLR